MVDEGEAHTRRSLYEVALSLYRGEEQKIARGSYPFTVLLVNLEYLPAIIMAADEIDVRGSLEEIKKLVSEAQGKILTEDLKIILQLQESLREVVKAHCSKGSNFIENVLRRLITENNYIYFMAKNAVLSSEAKTIEQKVPRLFEPIKQKVEDHLDAVERAKKRVTDLYKVITSQVDEVARADYKLSRECLLLLEIKKQELDGELKTWKSFMEDTERVLTEFDKEVNDYLRRESHKTKWMVGFLVVGATVFTGGAGAIASSVGAIAAAGIGATPLIGGGAAGGFLTSLATGGIVHFFKEKTSDELHGIISNFKAKLEKLKKDYLVEKNHSETLDTNINTLREKKAMH